jgi:PAS domain S-box-containing protein
MQEHLFRWCICINGGSFSWSARATTITGMNPAGPSDPRYRVLVDALEEGFVFGDRHGRVVFSNPAASRILGRTPDQLTGRSAHETEWRATFEDGTADPDRHPSMTALRTGQPVSDVVMRLQHPPQSDTWVSVNAFPVFEDGGSAPTGVVVSFTDITESRRTRAALKASERRYRMIVETALEGIWAFDADGGTTYVNERMAQLLGRPAAELVGLSMREFLDDEGRATAGLNGARSRTGISEQHDLKLVRDDGTFVWAMISSRPLLGDDGEYVGSIALVTDLTERRRTEAALREAELERQRQQAELENSRLQTELTRAQRLESLGRLSGGVAHDFNNLLGVILNYAGFLTKRIEPGDPLAADVAEIRRAAERAAELTRQLLLFGRREVTRPTAFYLRTVVDDLAPMLRRTLGTDVELVVRTSSEPTLVFADRGQIEQVLMNLVLNARDAISGHGTVTVGVERLPGAVELSVSDDGGGMSPEVLDQAFEPFFTTKSRDGGSGLGLASVHGIVSQAGGEVTITTSPGVGTRINVRLPPPARHLAAESARTADKVLVVDDEAAVRAVTARMLRESGYVVVEAGSGVEALDRIGSDAADTTIVITDVVMPSMSGPELAGALRTSRPDIKVLLMSGYAHGELGLDDPRRSTLLAKPFDEEQLIAAVLRTLRSAASG